MTDIQNLSAAAEKLSPIERLELVDLILESLDVSDSSLDSLWAKEAEQRLDAYRRGEIGAVSLKEALTKYSRA